MLMEKDKTIIVKFFKNKTQMVIYLFLILLFMIGFIYFGSKEYIKDIPDNERFAEEHKNADINNVYKYLNATETYSYIKEEDVLLLIGIKNSEYVSFYANILNDVAKDLDIKEINYYDITEDRLNNNATYESIVNYFKDYVTYLDNGTQDLYGPTLVVKKAGVITLFDDTSAFIKGNIPANDYYNNYETNLIKITIETALKDYLEKGVE